VGVPPISRKADDVAGDLLRRIVSGDIAVGTMLPRESDLAERYGVGRSVVREANKLLEVHRLVRPTRRKGTVVLDPMCSVTPAVLSAMLFDAQGRIDRAMLAEFLEIRADLDRRMTELAAERRTRADLTSLERAAARVEAAEAGSREHFDGVNAFGVALARASKNRIFEMLAHWHLQIAARLEPLLSHVRIPVAQQQGHRVLISAIERRDAALAGEMVGEFHRWATQRLLDAAREQNRKRPSPTRSRGSHAD
jgi:GntR family transcriptional repressor for pyruvate dehydrogenase complex